MVVSRSTKVGTRAVVVQTEETAENGSGNNCGPHAQQEKGPKPGDKRRHRRIMEASRIKSWMGCIDRVIPERRLSRPEESNKLQSKALQRDSHSLRSIGNGHFNIATTISSRRSTCSGCHDGCNGGGLLNVGRFYIPTLCTGIVQVSFTVDNSTVLLMRLGWAKLSSFLLTLILVLANVLLFLLVRFSARFLRTASYILFLFCSMRVAFVGCLQSESICVSPQFQQTGSFL